MEQNNNLPDYVNRLREERDQLMEKFGKLHDFINSDRFNNIPVYKKELLTAQSCAMSTYLSILNIRLHIELGESCQQHVDNNYPENTSTTVKLYPMEEEG